MTITSRMRPRSAATAVGALALTSFLIAGLVSPAAAAPVGDIGVLDPDTNQSKIVVTKYTSPDNNPATTPNSSAGTGLPAAMPAGSAPLAGVTFSIQRVVTNPGNVPLNLSTNAGWASADVVAAAFHAVPSSIPAGYALAAYDLDAGTAGVQNTLTTTASGVVTFDNLPFGLYVITETAAPTSVTGLAAPFMVSLPFPTLDNLVNNENEWLYTVNVYPKNSTTSVTKDVNPVTVDPAFATAASYASWTITATVPRLASGVTLDKFIIRDTVTAAELEFPATTINGSGAYVSTGLPAGVSDFSVTVGGVAFPRVQGGVTMYNIAPATTPAVAAGKTAIEFVFTQEGRTLLNTSHQGATVAVTVPTRVLTPATVTLINDATLYANDATLTDDASQPFGQLTVFKYAATTGTTPAYTALPGTKFRLYADAGVIGTYEAALDGLVTVNAVNEFTVPANGILVISGLKPGTYLLEESEPLVGYRPLGSFIPVTVVAGNSVTPADPTDTADNYVAVENSQYQAWELPFTGGNGVLTFTLLGAGLMALALGLALVARRRAQRAEA